MEGGHAFASLGIVRTMLEQHLVNRFVVAFMPAGQAFEPVNVRQRGRLWTSSGTPSSLASNRGASREPWGLEMSGIAI